MAMTAMVFAVAGQERRVLPPDPQAGETFAYIAALPYGKGSSQFTTTSALRDGIVITVAQPRVVFDGPNQWSRFGAAIEGLAVGSYAIRGGPYENKHAAPFAVPPFETTVTVGPGSPATPRYRELDGNWFDPAQPGWGVNLVQGESGALFAVYLAYTEIGFADIGSGYSSKWLVMPSGRWSSETSFRGLLYESIGTRLPQEPRSSHVTVVGMATLDFVGEDRMRFTVLHATNNGNWVEGTWTLRRFAF